MIDLFITGLIIVFVVVAKIVGLSTAPWWFIVVASILLLVGSLIHSGMLKVKVEKVK